MSEMPACLSKETPHSFSVTMLAVIPSLTAFANSLCGNIELARDLVQETILRAWANKESFEPTTNMAAWLFTILRDLFKSHYRKRRREVEDPDGSLADQMAALPEQSASLELAEFRQALRALPVDQREALILVGASGFSYDEAAIICGFSVSTIKSRVNRARSSLAQVLHIESATDFGPDRQFLSILYNSSYPEA
jgi:RNA polymerase sigma-70 factor (ECF subfamily)